MTLLPGAAPLDDAIARGLALARDPEAAPGSAMPGQCVLLGSGGHLRSGTSSLMQQRRPALVEDFRRLCRQWVEQGFQAYRCVTLSAAAVAFLVTRTARAVAAEATDRCPYILLPCVQSGSVPSQQTRHARRIYAGNLPAEGCGERDVEAFFASLVRTGTEGAGSAFTGQPVLSVYLNSERKFAFVELASIELANALVLCDGLQFRGQTLRIRRPDDYAPASLPADVRDRRLPFDYSRLPLPMGWTPGGAGAGGAGGARGGSGSGGGGAGSSGSGANPNRLYIGGIPAQLDEGQLRMLLTSFGPLQRLDIPRPQMEGGPPRGYAFAEFDGPDAASVTAMTDRAIAGLDGLAVADKKLSVSRAKAAQAAIAATGGAPHMGAPAAPMLPAAHAMPPAAMSGPCVCVLEGVVGPAELDAGDAIYQEVIADFGAEASRFGPLVDLKIPRPPAPGAGRVFLRYAHPGGVAAALAGLCGRQFAGRTIVGRPYDDAAFASGVYTL